MTVEATLSGDGCRLTLRVHAYERPRITTGEDANWLVGDAELTLGTTGSFSARHRLSLYAPDLAAFTAQLRALDHDLAGQAKLDHIEGQVEGTITLSAGKGTFAGHLREHIGATLSFDQIPTDQTRVREALRQFVALTNAFPAR